MKSIWGGFLDSLSIQGVQITTTWSPEPVDFFYLEKSTNSARFQRIFDPTPQSRDLADILLKGNVEGFLYGFCVGTLGQVMVPVSGRLHYRLCSSYHFGAVARREGGSVM